MPADFGARMLFMKGETAQAGIRRDLHKIICLRGLQVHLAPDTYPLAVPAIIQALGLTAPDLLPPPVLELCSFISLKKNDALHLVKSRIPKTTAPTHLGLGLDLIL